jgi:integrase
MKRKPESKPTPRRVRGTGYVVYHKERKLWVARRPCGRTPGGRTRYQEASDKSQAKALEKLSAMLPPARGVTVRDWLSRWLAGLDVRPATMDNYEFACRDYLIPDLGHIKLAALTSFQVETAARRWVAGGANPNTAKLHLSALSVALNAAVREGVISSNPVRVARRPKGAAKVIDPFTRDELARIIADGSSHTPTSRVCALLAATGLRVGEAIALDVEDYDAATGLLSITRTCHDRHGTGPAKSKNSVRTIRVPTSARAALVAAVGGRKTGILFPATRAGGRLKHFTLRHVWARLLTRLGLRFRNPHSLRHSTISIQLAAGYAVADVARYHGNSAQVIMRTYCQPVGQDPSQALEV